MEQFDELREQLKRLMPENENHAVIIPPSYKLAASLCKALKHAKELEEELEKTKAQLAEREAELHELEQAVLMATIEQAIQTGEIEP
jgi:hypothetical protein